MLFFSLNRRKVLSISVSESETLPSNLDQNIKEALPIKNIIAFSLNCLTWNPTVPLNSDIFLRA